MNILGIETSCDETAASVVRDGKTILSSVVFSQVPRHQPYGGVVPEIAARSHVEILPGLLEQTVQESGVGWNGVDAVAFTYGPGLASSLLVGISAAKGLAMSLDRPLIGINHIEAHMFSVFLAPGAPSVEEACPFLCLVVSGGHTCLVRVRGVGKYDLLGQTSDDAAGEAFDKGAKLLGLGYPGGPIMDKTAKGGDTAFISFPRMRHKRSREELFGLDPELCFSFSGLKTALLYYLKDHPLSADRSELPAIAASYQEAIVRSLVDRTEKALDGDAHIAAAGGVSLNSRLRQELAAMAARQGVRLLLAPPGLCMDNAAMVASIAGLGGGIRGPAAMELDAEPSLELPGIAVAYKKGAIAHHGG